MKQHEQTQQAVETVTRQYDDLRSQGVGHAEALNFITLEHGIIRPRLAAIINDHLAGLHGQSGTTVIGSSTMSTPAPREMPCESALRRPTHGGYPGDQVATVEVPDTFPEEWSR